MSLDMELTSAVTMIVTAALVAYVVEKVKSK